jgi:hypothetical protein
LDLSNLQQVVEDWSKPPFVEIKAFPTPCEGEWESVWERRWGGMEEGCVREGQFFSSYVETHVEWEKTKLKNAVCKRIKEEPPVVQAELFEQYFCGRRGGYSFKDVTRPDWTTK